MTAFALESYTTLQEDSGDVSARVLIQISQQLNSFVVNPGFINSTTPSPAPSSIPSFQPQTSSIRINALWFLSLFLSLFCSSGAILIKQWLRAYPVSGCSARKHLRIWWFRSNALRNWHVYDFAAVLPLLLQTALILFLIGLGEFVRQLNPIVGWIITASMIIWLTIFTAVTFLPVVSIWCPYKTPLLQGSLTRFRWFLTELHNKLCGIKWAREKFKLEYIWNKNEGSWLDREADDWVILDEVFRDHYDNLEVVKAIQTAASSLQWERPEAIPFFLMDISSKLSGRKPAYETNMLSTFSASSREGVIEMLVEALERALSQGQISSYSSPLPNWVSWSVVWLTYGNHYSKRAFEPNGIVLRLLSENEELRKFVLSWSCWNEMNRESKNIRWIDPTRKSYA